jgi:DNA-binding CsgD family transcriptional regulator
LAAYSAAGHLNPRQRDVVRLLAEKRTPKETAASPRTVETNK